ncbi:MAG: transposase, partial [Actinomycetota bacterium]|nr:transposase [Actinomycetota bacterium]
MNRTPSPNAPSVQREEPVMVSKRVKYSAEFKAEAVRMVIEHSRPITDVARELGVHDGTLGNWVNKYRDEHPVEE